MNAGLLPFLVAAAAVAMSLTIPPWRPAIGGALAFAACALITSFVRLPDGPSMAVFVGLWVSVIATAGLVLIPRDLPPSLPIAAAIHCGLWCGGVASVSDMRSGLAFALPILLFFVPGRWFRYHGRQIVLKVIASWLIALSALATFVSLVPTPGYERDHME